MRTVIIVHEEGRLRDAFQRALTEAGFEVLAAEYGAAAIELLRRRRPTLVFLHELCGWTCAELIDVTRHLDPGGRVVVFTSAEDADEKDRQERLGIRFLSPSGIAQAARETIGSREAPPVLVVDDEPLVRQTLQRLLRDRGYEVSAVPSGQEALDFLRRTGSRLVLLDIDMPGIDGLETLRRIRELERRPGVIMIAGDGSGETMRTCKDLGALDYIQKPLDFIRLESCIREVASRMAP